LEVSRQIDSTKSHTEESFRHESIVLKPLSYDVSFENIVLSEDEITKFSVRGIFKKVLNWI